MKAMLLDENSYYGLHNGYSIWVTIQGGFKSLNETFFLSVYKQLCIIVWWQLGSQATWSVELSDNDTAAACVYCNNGRRNCRCLCKALRQRFSARTSSGTALHFQKPA